MTQFRKLCIVSVDGLSLDDVEAFLSLVPSTLEVFHGSSEVVLNSVVLASAQAAWAEILTGKPWFVNGCAGYARPTTSLNKLGVVTERDLLTPSVLLDEPNTLPVVTINLPLAIPKQRLWMADGSLPSNKIVSPNKLRDTSPFKDYVPRPLANLAVYEESAELVAQTMLNAELNRLDCAATLFKEQAWSKFFYRVSVFDSLTHLAGLNYLRGKDLSIFEQLKTFCTKLGDFLQTINEQRDVDLVVISSYSHVACRSVVNINSALAAAGFLQIDADVNANEHRARRVTSIAPILVEPPHQSMLSSIEGCLKPAVTLAASPVKGTVFINAKSIYTDGCVDANDLDNVYQKVRQFLLGWLNRSFGNAHRFEENPITDSVHLGTPSFVMYVEGIEFHNMIETTGRSYNIPRTMHSPSGFAFIPKRFESSRELKLSQLCGVVNASKNQN